MIQKPPHTLNWLGENRPKNGSIGFYLERNEEIGTGFGCFFSLAGFVLSACFLGVNFVREQIRVRVESLYFNFGA
jgi:hypothetical protein